MTSPVIKYGMKVVSGPSAGYHPFKRHRFLLESVSVLALMVLQQANARLNKAKG